MRCCCAVLAVFLSTACGPQTGPGGGGGGGTGGSGGAGGSAGGPTLHALETNDQQNIAAGSFYGASFSLPTVASVDFSIVDQGTNDTWTVGIFVPSDYSSWMNGATGISAIAAHNNVGTISDMATVNAGNWILGVKCTNLIEHCPFTLDLNATY